MFEFELPDVGEGVAEGEIVAWHVEPGEAVTVDQVLAEVETDKAVVDLPSPVEGVVERLHAEVGDIVPVGEVVVTIDTGDDDESGAEMSEQDASAPDASDATEPSEPEASTPDETGRRGSEGTTGRVFAPPRVRRIARELDIDIGVVEGSGPGGRITEDDVRAVAAVRESGNEKPSSDHGEDATAERASAEDRGEGESRTESADAGDRANRADDGGDESRTPAVRRRDPDQDDSTVGSERSTESESVDAPAHSSESESAGGSGHSAGSESTATSDRSERDHPEANERDRKSAVSRRETDTAESPAVQSEDSPGGTGDGRTDDGAETEISAAEDQNGSRRTTGGPDRDRTLAAPATRRLAEELGVDIDDVPTDRERNGVAFVEPSDVRAFSTETESAGATRPDERRSRPASTEGGQMDREPDAAAGTDHAGEPADGDDVETVPAETNRPVSREPYRGTRRTIGQQMSESAFTAPHATHHDTAVVERLVEMREELLPRASEAGVELTYLPFVMKAVAATLPEYPALNAELDEQREEIVYHDRYDIGVAVATDDGLLVPVVEQVDERGLLELAGAVGDLVERARSRELEPDQLRGSTFTVTNFGAIGGEYATPILNYPETGILGLGSIEPRPVVEDGDVVARHTAGLSLSIDHRVVDGAEAAAFCNDLKSYLTRPTQLLL
jgi:pyruvate dehydrogenase E2 component (dihydrolipoamide acetyltransferase)